jgi:hypothetical protein
VPEGGAVIPVVAAAAAPAVAASSRALVVGLGLLLAMTLTGAAGWFTNGWRHGAQIADLKRAHAEFRATLSEAALADVHADAATIRQAATEFSTIQSTLAPRMSALTKELHNARTTRPLPVDCRPDAGRVQNLDAAIDAANKSIPR